MSVTSQSAPTVRIAGKTYTTKEGETVLDVLLRNGFDWAHSCKKGTCLSCLTRCTEGRVPDESQAGLQDTLQIGGYFLACRCVPESDLVVERPDDGSIGTLMSVKEVEYLSDSVVRVVLEGSEPMEYRPGQFLNVGRPDGVRRSYSIASVPALGESIELHVRRVPGGAVSPWIYDDLRAGDTLSVQGPNGRCFYVPGREDEPLLLIGTGCGLAPLYGIGRDAISSGHRGPIHLYHGSGHRSGLYMVEELQALASATGTFTYVPCVSSEDASEGFRSSRADEAAFADLANLSGWRVYLCGHPPMVHGARQKAFMSGANMGDIYSDPFECSV
jgi:NAD(P)H-flavin reductase/ferredoxin